MSDLEPTLVPADDRGLLLGDGLFETLRLYAGRPFRLERHLLRLEASAEVFGIPVPPELRHRVSKVLAEWQGRDAVLRITLTRGSGPGILPADGAATRLLLWVRALDAAQLLPQGPLSARFFGRIDEEGLVAGHKTLGYLERVQALRLARLAGADEALLRNGRGLLVEGSASNLLAVQGSTLIAPGRGEGALPGITREALLEIAPELGLAVEERGIPEAELSECSELFLSSSVREVAAVGRVEGAPIGEGQGGPVVRALRARFRERVGAESGG